MIAETNNKIDIIIAYKLQNKTENKTQCAFCKKIYATSGSMSRHVNTSCIEKNKIYREKNSYIKKLNQLEKELHFLQVKLNNRRTEQHRQSKIQLQQNEIQEKNRELDKDNEIKYLRVLVDKLLEKKKTKKDTIKCKKQ